MAESRISTLRAIWAPRLVKVAFGAVALVAGYDSFSSQFGFPKLGTVLGMSGTLLPWWGWLLILQAIFVYALFEYVRRMSPARSQGINSGGLPVLDYTEMDELRGQLAEKVDSIFLRIGTVDRDLRNELDTMGDRLEKLDSKAETIEKLALRSNELQSERNDLIGKQIKAAVADAKAANDYVAGSVAAFQHLLGEAREAQAEASKEHASFKVVVERAIENTWRRLDLRCKFIDQGFKAVRDRERLLQLGASIEAVAEELSGPTRGEPLGDHNTWHAKIGGWSRNVETWSRIAEIYRVGVVERVHATPQQEYRGKWTATDNLFPDSVAIHDYKTFRIIYRNFREEREPVERCIELAAFASPSTKGRGDVDGEELENDQ